LGLDVGVCGALRLGGAIGDVRTGCRDVVFEGIREVRHEPGFRVDRGVGSRVGGRWEAGPGWEGGKVLVVDVG
jgi:hypothetical protein